MLRKSKTKPKTVSEKVTESLLHPNGNESDEESAEEATAPRVVDFEDDYDLPDAVATEIRKRNVTLLSEQSERYRGRISSRKELEHSDDGASDENDDEEDGSDDEDVSYEESDSDVEDHAAFEEFNKKLEGVKGDSSDDDDNGNNFEVDSELEANGIDEKENTNDDNEGSSNDDESEGTDDEEEENTEESDSENSTEDDYMVISKTNHEAEVQKGVCVQNQQRIWEKLLELRINSQKLLTKANQLPPPQIIQEALNNDNTELASAVQTTKTETTKLLSTLLELQTTLWQQHTEMKNAMKTTLKRTASTKSDVGPASKRIAEDLNSHYFTEFRPYRNAVLLKWDDRTKLLAPGAGAKKKSLNEDYDIVKKINSALANKSTLIEKSQLSKSATIAAAAPQDKPTNGPELAEPTRDVQIYDDSDFYHQQLRELIEYKASTSTNMSEITKQFVELQKLRQKMKKNVDTRASKGRKLRYVVHNKLINFMAPIEGSEWTDESKNELFKSLFV